MTACASPSQDNNSREAASDLDQLTQQETLQADALLAQALQADRIGDFEGALPLYQELLTIRPDPRVAERVSRIAAETNRWGVALSASSTWAKLDPASTPAQQMNIIARFRTGRTGAAIDQLAEQLDESGQSQGQWQMALALLTVAPSEERETTEAREQSMALLRQLLDRTGHAADSGFSNYQQSRLAWQLGEVEQGLALALEASRLQPDYIQLMWAAGLAVQLNQHDRAQPLYQQARMLQSDPASARAVQAALAEAEALNQIGQPDQAMALLTSLPDTLDTVYARALLDLEQERDSSALQHWQQLALLAETVEPPAQQRAYWLVAVLAEVLEQEGEAIAWYQRIDGERRAEAQLRQAGLLARNNQIDDARRLLASLRDGTNTQMSEQSYLVESQMLMEQGRHEQALDLLIEAVANQPGSLDLLYGRAMAAVQADRLELAEQDLRVIIQRDSQNAIALNALGYTLADRTDRQGEALRLIERALALDPDNPAILDSMGWVLFRLGQAEQALPYLERAAAGDFHPEIVSHLMEVLWTLGREQEAQALLARAEPEFLADAVFVDMLERTGLGN